MKSHCLIGFVPTIDRRSVDHIGKFGTLLNVKGTQSIEVERNERALWIEDDDDDENKILEHCIVGVVVQSYGGLRSREDSKAIIHKRSMLQACTILSLWAILSYSEECCDS